MFENIHINKHEMQETQIRDVPRQNLFYEPGYFYKPTVPGRLVGTMSQPGTGDFVSKGH